MSPLFVAILNGYKGMVKLLITNGADLNEKDYDGRTPLQYAEFRNRTEIIELLRKHGAK